MNSIDKKVLVIGASTKPDRYSYKAIKMLQRGNYQVVAIGIKNEMLGEIEIQIGKPNLDNIHTVTMYLGPQNQQDIQEYILSLKPKRVVFNPGTENPDFEKMLENAGIEVVEHCTLVMLNQGIF